MNLYLIITNEHGYDCYDSYIVCETNEEEAKYWFPTEQGDDRQIKQKKPYGTIETIKLIGKSVKGIPKGCLIGSYNAG